MPDGKGHWRSTNPPAHQTLIDNADVAQAGKLKPLVKLCKAWNIANGEHLSSLHVEMLVERMWRGHSIGAYSHAVKETIRVLPLWLATSLDDPWEGGTRIDTYLTTQTREQIVRMLNEDAKSSAEAEQFRQDGEMAKAFERWGSVYRQHFPAYG